MLHYLRRLTTYHVFVLLLLVNLVALSFQFRSHSGERLLKNWFFAVAAPVWGGIGQVVDSVGGYVQGVFTARQLQEENRRLRREIEELKFNRKAESLQRAQLARLEKLLNMLSAHRQGGVVVEIVARSFQIWDRAVMVEGGTRAGLQTELPVLSSDGVVGYTLRCSSSYSEVALLNNAGTAVAGKIVGKDIRGIIHGQGEALLRFDYVTLSAPVSVGDVIVSSGDDGIFPAGYRIGTVTDVGKTDQVFQRILVKPAADIRNKRYLLVLRRNGSEEQ